MYLDLVVGIVGMVSILSAFILDEFSSKWRPSSVRYNVLNVAGSAMLLYYGWTLKAWPFVVLNGAWLVAAVIKLENVAGKLRVKETGKQKHQNRK